MKSEREEKSFLLPTKEKTTLEALSGFCTRDLMNSVVITLRQFAGLVVKLVWQIMAESWAASVVWKGRGVILGDSPKGYL